ncbi:MAG: DinB family protein [Candidatus Promineifilaceae bacterium]|jgi:uncharacterized damage-inducible protein DinB
MNAEAFRQYYGYHFSQNYILWEYFISELSDEEFTQETGYSQGSVRNQFVHMINADDVWFSELSGVDPLGFPENGNDRRNIQAYMDSVVQLMQAYLAGLQDEMLFSTPITEPDDDQDLIVWQVLLHVVNHGTDHRAQILRQLNEMGLSTPPQDYIFYVYENQD